jgi:hypothetical protein
MAPENAASEAARALGRIKSERKAASSKKNLAKARLAQARKLLAQEPVVFQCPQTQPTKAAFLTVTPKQEQK